jgi:hypothetical protein
MTVQPSAQPAPDPRVRKDGGSLIDARHRVQEYLRRVAEAKRDEGLADDTDDRVGARHRVDLEIAWLGRYVYDNAHTLGMWDA